MRICSFVIPLGALAALGFIAVSQYGAHAGAAPEEAIAQLQERGYSDVEIEPNEAPGYQAWGCKSGTRFAINLDADSGQRRGGRGPACARAVCRCAGRQGRGAHPRALR